MQELNQLLFVKRASDYEKRVNGLEMLSQTY